MLGKRFRLVGASSRAILPVTLAFALIAAARVTAAEGVDVNAASAEELAQALDGVGEVRAESIVEHREANGPFAAPDELRRVDGVGPVTVEQNRERIRLGEAGE